MSEDVINQVIEASNEPEAPVEAPEETGQPEQNAEPKDPPKEEEAPFPKKAINALSRRDKQIGKLRAEREAYLNELTKLREEQAKALAPKEPTEEQFESYGEYLKALTKFHATQVQPAQPQQPQQPDYRQQQMIAQRDQAIAIKSQEAMKAIPDYQSVIQEHAEIADSFPEELQNAFYEAENPGLALYTLAKEGRLYDLVDMTPARAAMEIARAEVRGQQIMSRKPVTNAPAPISAAKGSGPATQRLETMSADEILKAARG